MWILKRKSDGRKLYLLSGEFTVGRKLSSNVQIQAPEDVSVSRQHFQIKVVYPASGLIKSEDSAFEIKDLGSTFGTYTSNPESGSAMQKISKDWIRLKEGATLVFGKLNEWTITWNDFSILLSAVGNAEKKKLIENLSKIGGSVVSTWSEDVAYLVMEKVMFTQKVLDGLLAQKPIVTAKFFENWMNALEQDPGSPLPDIALFIPPLDSQLVDQFDQKLFLPNQKRKTFFKGMTFIFPQQMPTSIIAVEQAGGNAVMDLGFDDAKQRVLLIEWNSQLPGNQKAYLAKLEKIKSSGQRAIPLREISCAILECSTERYCNPLFTINASATKSSSLSQSNSVDISNLTISREESCLNETGPPLKKKKIENSQDILNLEPPSKKVCLENVQMEDVEQENIGKVKLRPSPDFEPKRKISVNLINRSKELEASQDSIIQPAQSTTHALKKSRDHEKRNVSIGNTSKWQSSMHSAIPKLGITNPLIRSQPRLPKKIKTPQEKVVKRFQANEMKIVNFKDGKWVT